MKYYPVLFVKINLCGWLMETNATNGDFTPIPMWGESGLMKRDDDSKISGLKLLRMLARLDVALATDTAKDQFKLKSVRVYNRRNQRADCAGPGQF